MKSGKSIGIIFWMIILSLIMSGQMTAQTLNENPELDKKVRKFLDDHSGFWHDMNVPASDGKLLYDLIIKGNYKNALEIGTSTGYSGLYIAWALSKTGGKLITIEIDESRYKTALANFKEAGLAEYIDARLADAHALVKELTGPFDFVFSDADKGWLKNYFTVLDPKLVIGGCYTTHNISAGSNYGHGSYLNYIESLNNYKTTLNTEGNGMLISYKKAD